MSWIRGTAADYLALSDAIVAAATGRSIATLAVNVGGTGYTEGDIVTIDETGATGTITAQVEVSAVSGGVVTAVRIYNAGVYTVDPPTANTPSGGTGSGLTLTLTFAANGWSVLHNVTATEKEVILLGEGSGSDDIHVGWRTFHSVAADYYNLELHGFTGYNGAVAFLEQPGISPGWHEGSTQAEYSGAYLLAGTVPFEYFLSVNSSRITITIHVGAAYHHAYLGFGNRFATETEYPYPMVVAGSCSHPLTPASTGSPTSTMTDPWRVSLTSEGPMFIYGLDGQWYTICNRAGTSPTRWRVVVPTQQPYGVSLASGADKFVSDYTYNGFTAITASTSSGAEPVPTKNLLPTGDDDHRVTFPAIIVFSDPSEQVMMELDDVVWIHAFGGLTSEDRLIDDDGSVYRIFQNCNRTATHAYLAIKEN